MGRSGERRVGAVLLAAATLIGGCTSSGTPRHVASATPTTSVATSPSSTHSSTPTPTKSSAPKPAAKPRSTTPAPSAPKITASALPLHYTTGNASEVITVTARSTSSHTGDLQAWRKVAGGWRKVGPQVFAYLGTDGVATHPSESLSATPIGSFTLTQAFGHDANPGTSLPYTRTTPDDWWISEAGPLYNTRQRCASHCSFTRGDPNEHLYYETPYYNHAVVIDYNTRNAPGGVRQGAGSAFFLHVSVGQPTAGCVSIGADSLVRILRWLKPSAHPRILIGLG